MSTKKRAWKRSAFSSIGKGDAAEPKIQKSIGSNRSEELQKVEIKSETKNSVNENGNATKSTALVSGANWMNIFEPKNEEDLALHAKKLTELKQWFLDCQNTMSPNKTVNRTQAAAKICLVTGPAGAGKTATIRVLAGIHKFQIQEWINPLDHDVINTLGDQMFGETYVASQTTSFKSFLFQASRYKSLLEAFERRLLLVEDFPNSVLKDASAFEEILTDYIDYGKSPLIFIVSDSKSRSLDISYNLFSDAVKQKLQITHINFNPIASTIMQKAMKRFVKLMQQTEMGMANYKVPSQTVIDSIILSAQGDIRNALINFHFAALKGAPEISLCAAKLDTTLSVSSKKRAKKQSSLKSVGRDETCTMLHALGRVFNPKFTEEKKFVHSPETIATDFSTEPKKFLDFLHANYLSHFSDIDHVVTAIDALSLADVFLQEYRNNALSTLGLNVAVRGIMVANHKPVHAWLPIRGAKRYRPGETLKDSKFIMPGVPKTRHALDYGSLLKLIEEKQK